MAGLKRSQDRKVTNLATPNGKRSAIANTFGLPSGKNYSCPYATSICERICYAGKLEKMYSSVREVLLHNWNMLKDADLETMANLLDDMVAAFRLECKAKDAEMIFRIHWDGDFFSDTYTKAWRAVILLNPDIKFWVYTRNPHAARMLRDIDNLSLYYSADNENHELAPEGVKIAYLSDTFSQAKQAMLGLTGKPGASCPEQLKRIPLISEKGGACAVCRLCVDGKSDIRFSISKR
jgi:Gene product 88